MLRALCFLFTLLISLFTKASPEKFKEYLQLAEEGNVIAQYAIARNYFYGNHVEQSIEQSIYWYSKAVENKKQTNSDEQLEMLYFLGMLFDSGYYVEQSNEKAEEYYQKLRSLIKVKPSKERKYLNLLIDRTIANLGKNKLQLDSAQCDIRIQLITDSIDEGIGQYFYKSINNLPVNNSANLCLLVTHETKIFNYCDEGSCELNTKAVATKFHPSDIIILASSEFEKRYAQAEASPDTAVISTSPKIEPKSIAHEFLHLFEIFDHYPLPSGTDWGMCQPYFKSKNLLTLPSSLTAEHGSEIRKHIPWTVNKDVPITNNQTLGTPSEFSNERGLFRVNTCDEFEAVQAFKPLSVRTIMSLDSLYIPEYYQSIVTDTYAKKSHFSGKTSWHMADKFSETDNFAETLKWYSLAAEQGNSHSQLTLSSIYADGDKLDKDQEKSLYWLQRSAEGGNSQAQQQLGWIYKEGKLLTENQQKSFAWFKKAAENGEVYSQSMVGSAYLKGVGIDKNSKEAAYWLNLAAERGNAYAQTILAGMFIAGDGLEQSDDLAFFWYSKASEQGDATASRALKWMEENNRPKKNRALDKGSDHIGKL